MSGERSWKLALRGDEEWQRRLDIAKGHEAPWPREKLRVKVGYAFAVDLQGMVTREFKKNLEIRRFAKADREAVQLHLGEWAEPSEYLDRLVADFRYELELALRDAMPWDDEL